MYQLTNDPDVLICVATGMYVPKESGLWPTAWLEAGNTPMPIGGLRTLEALQGDLMAAATSVRWEKETGGIDMAGVRVGTGLDDQNRLSGVLASISLGGLERVDFKAQSGWVQLTAQELQGIALAISHHVQACFTAERAHHEAIQQIGTIAEAEAYDVTQGWPANSMNSGEGN